MWDFFRIFVPEYAVDAQIHIACVLPCAVAEAVCRHSCGGVSCGVAYYAQEH